MKKKSIIILTSVVILCALGLISSHYINWPVSSDDASGDISKSVRFSRSQDSEKLTNMEELIKTDTTYRNGVVTAYVVMQTRTIQFGSLVNMSNEVAGKIPEYADVLKDMNGVQDMVANVNSALKDAGKELEGALSGEESPNLTQNTITASLAYTVLQKQNKLANRFIETADQYLEKAEGNDRLKLVRDQWVEYQTMTAALEGDNEGVEAMAKKGSLLPAQQSLAAVASFDIASQAAILQSCALARNLGAQTGLYKAFPAQTLNALFGALQSAASITAQNAAANNLQSQQRIEIFCNNFKNLLANNQDLLANHKNLLANNQDLLANKIKLPNNSSAELNLAQKDLVMSTIDLANAGMVMNAYKHAMSIFFSNPSLQNQKSLIFSQVNSLISATAAGYMPKRIER